jgi:hypothetical protein
MDGRLARWALIATIPVLVVAVLLTRDREPVAIRQEQMQPPSGVESRSHSAPVPAPVEALRESAAGRSASADRPRPQSSRRRNRSGYDPQRQETVRGKVVGAARPAAQRRSVVPINPLVLETPEGKIAVRLGPPRFVRSLGLDLAPGDQVEVTGTRVRSGPRFSILAASISRNGQVVQLRDELGRPAWRQPPPSADAEAAPR